MALTTPQGKQFVRELTMEYIKQNQLLKCNTDKIDEQITKIATVSQLIENAVEKHYHDFKCL